MGKPRPLSPHLTVYRPLIGSYTSILHRAVGAALLGGLGLFALWLLAVAEGGAWFDHYSAFWGSFVGKVMLFGWTFCAFFYAAHWVRHFAWDMGYGFELATARRSARLALIGSAVAAVLVWLYIALRAG
ncbi:MAG: succinate dehydrogenase, cytochrome b556 subunit [Immundisolibacter sp.]|uniref:succinate dehydrogenase, cytochrome b556 subunit n=1 Tax=Immundisolibacter sp. TaxID=1934948 RepID=UPI003EE30C9F